MSDSVASPIHHTANIIKMALQVALGIVAYSQNNYSRPNYFLKSIPVLASSSIRNYAQKQERRLYNSQFVYCRFFQRLFRRHLTTSLCKRSFIPAKSYSVNKCHKWLPGKQSTHLRNFQFPISNNAYHLRLIACCVRSRTRIIQYC